MTYNIRKILSLMFVFDLKIKSTDNQPRKPYLLLNNSNEEVVGITNGTYKQLINDGLIHCGKLTPKGVEIIKLARK